MKNNIFSNFLIVIMVTVTLQANDAEDFESLLEDVSSDATKKSLNVDYLPSVVTVIDAQMYIDGGITNLGEALGMLPGIQIQLSPMGYTMVTVRGLKNPNAYLSDKIKILVDGVAINNEISGSSNFYMDFPMRLVEKIEVLRGPGSTVYGAGAFYATINVITKLGNSQKENQAFIGIGSYNSKILGGNLNAQAGDWRIFTDGYYQKNDKSVYDKNYDKSTDESLKDYSLGFKAKNDGFEFLARYKRNVSGNFYSFEGEYDLIPEQKKEHINGYFFTQLSYETSLNDAKLQTKANFSHRELDTGANINSVVDIANKFALVDVDMQDGFFYHEMSHEQNMEVESILTLPQFQSNDISLGVGARRVKVEQDEFYSSVENAITENLDAIVNHVNYNDFAYRQNKETAFWANPTTKLLKDNLRRDIVYAHAQDLISVSNYVDVVLGLRADHYSDFGAQMSKRAAIVYRATDATVFKLLYGSAFRAPTFIEAYQNGHINFRAGDENIAPEETDTYEAVAIYSPDFNNKFLLNVFYSQLSNVIDLEEYPDTNPGYRNYKERYSKGVEFEYFFHPKMRHNFYLNATYVDAEYTIPPEDGEVSIDQSMPDISKVMLKAMYIYTPIKKLSFGTAWRYENETTATELAWVKDRDVTVDAHHIFDETVTYRFSSSSELALIVKNVLDAEIRQPSYYYGLDGGILREERNFFLNFTQRF